VPASARQDWWVWVMIAENNRLVDFGAPIEGRILLRARGLLATCAERYPNSYLCQRFFFLSFSRRSDTPPSRPENPRRTVLKSTNPDLGPPV